MLSSPGALLWAAATSSWVAPHPSGWSASSLGLSRKYRCAMSCASCVGVVVVSQMCCRFSQSACSIWCGSVQACAPAPR
eukprot:5750022-Prorocentrum_lima.AAC.1